MGRRSKHIKNILENIIMKDTVFCNECLLIKIIYFLG